MKIEIEQWLQDEVLEHAKDMAIQAVAAKEGCSVDPFYAKEIEVSYGSIRVAVSGNNTSDYFNFEIKDVLKSFLRIK